MSSIPSTSNPKPHLLNSNHESLNVCIDDASRIVYISVPLTGDADALVRGRFGTYRMTMLCMGDDASRVVIGFAELHIRFIRSF